MVILIDSYRYGIIHIVYFREMPLHRNIPEAKNLREERVFIYCKKQKYTLVCGMITSAIYSALTENELDCLKLIISQFCYEKAGELADTNIISSVQIFKDLNLNNIYRFTDSVWVDSMLDEESEKVSADCPCMVSFYKGEINIRWTLPTQNAIWSCQSAHKLAYTAMVIVEELFHMRQMITPNTRAIATLGIMLEFDRVNDISNMEEGDKSLLTRLLESDVTFFLSSYFKGIENLQWFEDRISANDDHKPMTPQEFISAIMYLCNKYGYPEEVGEDLQTNIEYFIEMNPELGSQMLETEGLEEFTGKKR